MLKYIDEGVEVTVSANRKVSYEGEELSLTRATRKLLGNDYDVQPTPYWYFNGRSLTDIYNETYKCVQESS